MAEAPSSPWEMQLQDHLEPDANLQGFHGAIPLSTDFILRKGNPEFELKSKRLCAAAIQYEEVSTVAAWVGQAHQVVEYK